MSTYNAQRFPYPTQTEPCDEYEEPQPEPQQQKSSRRRSIPTRHPRHTTRHVSPTRAGASTAVMMKLDEKSLLALAELAESITRLSDAVSQQRFGEDEED